MSISTDDYEYQKEEAEATRQSVAGADAGDGKAGVENRSLSRSTLRRLIARKRFPIPVQIAARRIAFFEDEIACWQEEIGRARGSPPAGKRIPPGRPGIVKRAADEGAGAALALPAERFKELYSTHNALRPSV